MIKFNQNFHSEISVFLCITIIILPISLFNLIYPSNHMMNLSIIVMMIILISGIAALPQTLFAEDNDELTKEDVARIDTTE